VPGTGTPEPDRGFWVRLAVAAVAVLLAGGYVLTRGGDDQVGTAAGPTTTPSATSSSSASSSGPATTIVSPTPSPTKTARPPTLAFTVRYPAYITVRVPGGRTLVSKLFKTGAKASYDQKVLQVVNGTPRKPGPTGQTETFTVRRR
jgi:hypothetical protein